MARWSPRWGIVPIMGLLLSSCTVTRDGDNPSAGTAETDTISTVGSTQQYPDRDPQQVQAGLAKIQPCDLLSQTVLDAHHFPAGGDPVENKKKCRQLGNDLRSEINIELGEEFSETAHYMMQPIELNGFAAYFQEITMRGDDPECEARIPVSFTQSIRLRVRRDLDEAAFEPCALVQDLAAHAITRTVDIAGEQLLFRPGEKDENVEGACVHWLSAGTRYGCVPYRETDVPDEPQQLLDAAHGNANITCAAALDIVRDVLGDQMEPVTYGQNCVFVEPTHEVNFSLVISDAYTPDHYRFHCDKAGACEDIEIDGHPGFSANGGDGQRFLERFYYVSTGSDTSNAGQVEGHLWIQTPRGAPLYTLADKSKLDIALPAMEQLMARYF